MKISRYSLVAALVALFGFVATAMLTFGAQIWLIAVCVSPISIGTGHYVAHKFRAEIRDEVGWRIVPISIMIGCANVFLFYVIVAGIGGLGGGLVLGIGALVPALAYSALVSPVAYLAMRIADRWDVSGAISA